MELDNENASTEAGTSEILPQETTATEIAQVIYDWIDQVLSNSNRHKNQIYGDKSVFLEGNSMWEYLP